MGSEAVLHRRPDGIADFRAGLSRPLAGEKRASIEKLRKEADDIEANIKDVDDKLGIRYYECENGREKPDAFTRSHSSRDETAR